MQPEALKTQIMKVVELPLIFPEPLETPQSELGSERYAQQTKQCQSYPKFTQLTSFST